MKMEFKINCMTVLECIVNRENLLTTNKVMHNLYKNYTKENMTQAIKHINMEFKRLNLNSNMEYVKAYDRLKTILKNIEELKVIYQDSTNVSINEESFLTICNKQHYNNKYFTVGIQNNYVLTIHDKKHNYSWISPYSDVWSSKEDDVTVALDRNNNAYRFIFKDNKYILQDAYSIACRNLTKGLSYKTFYGITTVL